MSDQTTIAHRLAACKSVSKAGEDSGVERLSRRGFLIVALGASVAFRFIEPASAAVSFGAKADGSAQHFSPSIWYEIDGSGIVTVNIKSAEMGQHVGTACAIILAEELEVEWKDVRITHVDSGAKWGLMMTGGSQSIFQAWPLYGRAGAAGRQALITAGAALLKVDPAECQARAGVVVAGDKSISYGDIIKQGPPTKTLSPDEFANISIKPPSERRLIGKKIQALDIPAKTNGSAIYGIDAKAPGMVYARPKLPPTRLGSKVESVDDSQAKTVKGYKKYLVLDDPTDTVPGWVVVIADSYPAAIKATDLLKVVWSVGPAAKISEKDIQAHGLKLIADPKNGALIPTGGDDTQKHFSQASSKLEQTYTTATVLHFQLEPLNALAFEKEGMFEIHTGNQWQSLILPTLAKALGRPEEKIVLRTYLLGGGFGRRLNGDYALGAALAAKMLGVPVKMILTREDESLFDGPRSPSVQTLAMAFDANGAVTAMDHAAAAGWPTQVLAPPGLEPGLNNQPYDSFAISGADHWYDVGAHRIRAISNDLANSAMRPGFLRSVGPGWTNWAVENFMDEAARHSKKDPVQFRLNLLNGKGGNVGSAPNAVGGALRQANVLKIAAEKGGWGAQNLPADTGLGVASSFGQERRMPTWCACVARLRVDRSTGAVHVEKITIVVDAGAIIDRQGAMAQVQGGALWGLSMALHEGTRLENGRFAHRNLDTYTPLRMANTPEMDITFVDNDYPPVGLGEPATTIIAPAIGNAIFNATGARLRDLPITPAALRAALAKI